jgi:hypothetical protein
VIPASAILVVGDDNGAILPNTAVLDCLNQIGNVFLSRYLHRVTRMLIVDPGGFDKRDGGQVVAL